MGTNLNRFGCWVLVLLLSLVSVGAAGPDLRLLDAVKQGDSAAVRGLLKAGVDVNTRAGDDASALHEAVARGDQETTQLLIQAGATVNAVNDLGVTPLLVASSIGNASIVAELLEAGGDPTIANSTGVTSLMMASRRGDLESVKRLLTHGANVNAKESTREQTALMWAVVHHHADVVQRLIKAGADVHARSGAWREKFPVCCRQFVDDPSDGTMFVNFGGYTALMYAAQQGDLESAQRLLAAGATVDDTAADGTTALVIAAFAGRGALAAFLLDQGAAPNADAGGYSALHVAVLRDDVALVKALVGHGANLNARLAKPTFLRGSTIPAHAFDKQWIGATPFWLAAAFHDFELVQILAAGGADAGVPRGDGNTPLLAAVGTKKVIDLRRETREGPSRGLGIFVNGLPDAEEQRVTPEVIKFIVGLGVDVNATNDEGDTALHRASAKRNLSAVKFLAEHGARLDIKNNQGQTPLAVARAERPYPPHVTSDVDTNRKLWTDTFDAPREQLVALLRALGATE